MPYMLRSECVRGWLFSDVSHTLHRRRLEISRGLTCAERSVVFDEFAMWVNALTLAFLGVVSEGIVSKLVGDVVDPAHRE